MHAVTLPGMVVGTVAYLSPEQACGKEVHAPSDIFSFGCVGYEMLQGQPPFLRATPMETMAAILQEEPSYEQWRTKIPAPLIRLLQDCLKKNPADRIQNGQQLTQALAQLHE